MNNILTMTEFLNFLIEKGKRFELIYYVPKDKTYRQTVNSLTATAVRLGIKISTNQVTIVEAGKLSEYGVRVKVK